MRKKQINLNIPVTEHSQFCLVAASRGINLSLLFTDLLRKYKRITKPPEVSLPARQNDKAFTIQLMQVDSAYFSSLCKKFRLPKSTVFRIINSVVFSDEFIKEREAII